MTINNPTPSQEPQLWALWREAFGDSEEFLNQFIATAYRSDRCLCAVEDGKVVSAAYWFHCTHDIAVKFNRTDRAIQMTKKKFMERLKKFMKSFRF